MNPSFNGPVSLSYLKDQDNTEAKVSKSFHTRKKTYSQNSLLKSQTNLFLAGQIDPQTFFPDFFAAIDHMSSNQLEQLTDVFPFDKFYGFLISQNEELFLSGLDLIAALLSEYDYGDYDEDSKVNIFLQPSLLDSLIPLMDHYLKEGGDHSHLPSFLSLLTKIINIHSDAIQEIPINLLELAKTIPLSQYSVKLCDILLENGYVERQDLLEPFKIFFESNSTDIQLLTELLTSIELTFINLEPEDDEEEQHSKIIEIRDQYVGLFSSYLPQLLNIIEKTPLMTDIHQQESKQAKQILEFYEHFYRLLSIFPNSFDDQTTHKLIKLSLERMSQITSEYVQNTRIYSSLIQMISNCFIHFHDSWQGPYNEEICAQMYRFCKTFSFSATRESYLCFLQYFIPEFLETDAENYQELILSYAQVESTFQETISHVTAMLENDSSKFSVDTAEQLKEAALNFEDSETLGQIASEFLSFIEDVLEAS